MTQKQKKPAIISYGIGIVSDLTKVYYYGSNLQ